MTITKNKPTTPGIRFKKLYKNDLCEKIITLPFLSSFHSISSGRNNRGRIVVRSRITKKVGSYARVDHSRSLLNVPAKVVMINKDRLAIPSRTLVCYQNGVLSYITSIQNLKLNQIIWNTLDFTTNLGCSSTLDNFLPGSSICSVSFNSFSSCKIARSRGVCATLLGKYNDNYSIVRLPSSQIRVLPSDCIGVLGGVSGEEFRQSSLGKASVSRILGKRPSVRGVAMNPVDHPHGGGEGRTSGGRPSVSYKGWPTKGKFKHRGIKVAKKKYIL